MRSKRNQFALKMESLENREVPASVSLTLGVLKVEGSNSADIIQITTSNQMVNATVRDSTTGLFLAIGSFSTVQVTSLRVDAFDGNDIIKNKTSLNSDIRGGNGNDQLFGGTGADMLCGGFGNDVLMSIGGGSADILWGQADVDSFWLDSEATERIGDLEATEISKGHVHRVAGFRTNMYELDLNDDKVVQDQAPVSEVISRTLNGQNLMDPPQRQADGNLVIRNFSGNLLFSVNGPSANDINQGNLGDCYFLSAIGAVADRNPDRIRQLVADLGDGTYVVHFRNSNGTDAFVRVDADLWVSPGSTTPSYAGLGTDGSLWVAIMEKAWAFHRHNQSTASLSRGGYDSASNADGYYARTGEVLLHDALNLPSVACSNGSPENAPAGNPGGVPTDSDFATQQGLINFLRNELSLGKAVTLSAHSSLGNGSPLVRTFAAPDAEILLRKDAISQLEESRTLYAAFPDNDFFRRSYETCQAELAVIDARWQANSWAESPTYRRGQHVYMVVSVSADNQIVTLRNPGNGRVLVTATASDLFFTCRGIRTYQVS